MEMDVYKFLDDFDPADLVARGVFTDRRNLLQGESVPQLLSLMVEHGVTRLVSATGNWSLAANGDYRNRTKCGNFYEKFYQIADRPGRGIVFDDQNNSINPHNR